MRCRIEIRRFVTLTVILCGCETWSLILREECRLMVFENSVLRRISGSKKEEVRAGRRKSQKEQLQICIHYIWLG